jgi:sugar phosphate isomerase/epimerase
VTPRLDNIELVLANGCLKTPDLVERCAAASAAGFRFIGLSAREYGRLRSAGRSDQELAGIVADHGLKLIEIETIAGLAESDEPSRQRHTTRAGREQMYDMAAAFGSRYIQAVGSFTDPLEHDVVERFAAICDEASEHGLAIALEFVPCTNIADAATALRIVTEADRPNGGLCVDIWHHTRGANDWSMIEAIPAERVIMIQLDDGPLVPRHPDFLTDTTANRDLPGEGEFEIDRFLQLLWRNGADAPISVEVLDDRLYALAPAEAAQRLFASATAAVVRASSAL